MLMNCNLMIFNETGINRKLFEPVLTLIALYFDREITHTKAEEALFLSAQNFINKIIIFNVSIDEKDRVTRKYFAVYF